MKYILSLFFTFILVSTQAQLIDTLVLTDEYAVLFGSDEWNLPETELTKLDSLFILANKSNEILLEGHTDKVGSIKYNQALSAKRVQAVYDRLLHLGIPDDKIISHKFGELQPVERGEDESAFKLNRRVDIKFFKLEKRRKLKGKVEEEESKESLLAKVKVTGKNFSDSTSTNIDGGFSIAVPDNGVYKLEITSPNHFFEQRFIKISSKDPDEFNIGLPEIKIGSIYTLPNFNFKGNLPILLKRSVPTLDLLYELMHESDICIEIKGHINLPNQPDCLLDTRHYKLSVNRANMVFENMISRGISSERMLPKGYGNWEMLFPKAAVENDMIKNRRVEIKIIDCNSTELTSKSIK